MEHYQKTKYPLAVKLGTITPDGGDVFSYAEDDMVEDPRLTHHLKHFGIDIASMTKVTYGVASRRGCGDDFWAGCGRADLWVGGEGIV